MSDIYLKDLKTLKDVYNDLCRTVDKLYTVSANTKNDDLFLKLNKIINTVLQAKYELADDVIEPFENSLKDKE